VDGYLLSGKLEGNDVAFFYIIGKCPICYDHGSF